MTPLVASYDIHGKEVSLARNNDPSPKLAGNNEKIISKTVDRGHIAWTVNCGDEPVQAKLRMMIIHYL